MTESPLPALVKINNPLIPHNNIERYPIMDYCGKTLRETVNSFADLKTYPYMVSVNGEYYSMRTEDDYEIKRDDFVAIQLILQGDQEDTEEKGIGLLVAGGLAIATGGVLGVAGVLSGLATFGTIAGGVGLGIAGYQLVNTPIPPSPDVNHIGSTGSPNYHTFQNSIRLGQPIPLVYGKQRVVPDFVERSVPNVFVTNNPIITRQTAVFALSLGQVHLIERRYGNTSFALTIDDPDGTVDADVLISAPNKPIVNPVPPTEVYKADPNQDLTVFPDPTVEAVDISSYVYQNTDPENVEIPNATDSEGEDKGIGWYIVNPSGSKIKFINPIIFFPDGLDTTDTGSSGVELKMIVQKIDDKGEDITNYIGPPGFTNGRATFTTRVGRKNAPTSDDPESLMQYARTGGNPFSFDPGRWKVKFYLKEGTRSSTFGERKVNLVSVVSSITKPPYNYRRAGSSPALSPTRAEINKELQAYNDITILKGSYNIREFPFDRGADRNNYIIERRLPQLIKDFPTNKIYYVTDFYQLPRNGGRTRNPVWALLDVLTNQDYGVGLSIERIDFDSFYEMATILEKRGDTFDYTVDRFQGAAELIRTVLRVGRLILIPDTGIYTLVRDQHDNNPVLFIGDNRVVKNSFQAQYKQYIDDNADGIEIEFINEDSFEADSVIVGDVAEPLRPQRIKFAGITKKDHAIREGTHIWNSGKYRRETYKCKVSSIAGNLTVADKIALPHHRLYLSQSGNILDIDDTGVITIRASAPPALEPELVGQGIDRIETTHSDDCLYQLEWDAFRFLPQQENPHYDVTIADMGLPTRYTNVSHLGSTVSYDIWESPGRPDIVLVRYVRADGFVGNIMYNVRTTTARNLLNQLQGGGLAPNVKFILEGNSNKVETVIGEGELRDPVPFQAGVEWRGISWFKLDRDIKDLFRNPYDTTDTAARPLVVKKRVNSDTANLTYVNVDYANLRSIDAKGRHLTAEDHRLRFEGVTSGGDPVDVEGFVYSLKIEENEIEVVLSWVGSTPGTFISEIVGFDDEYSIELINITNYKSFVYSFGASDDFDITHTRQPSPYGNQGFTITKKATSTISHDFRDLFKDTEPMICVRSIRNKKITENTPSTITKDYITISDSKGYTSPSFRVTRISDYKVQLYGTWTITQIGDVKTATKDTGETLDFYVGNAKEKTQCAIRKGNREQVLAVVEKVEIDEDAKSYTLTCINEDPRVHDV